MSRLLGDLPRLFPRPEQTIAGIGRLLRKGEVSCADILIACLEQVDEWEPKVHAWVVLDREGAMNQARSLDEELRAGNDRGSLHGIPMGIKDIINAQGLPTACGAKRWANQVHEYDGPAVGALRAAGAVIMGKTVATPYAWIDPPITRNPWNLDRTPGGSSSGSAAAVSCGMCYAALGSQTGGSITRPASFCGVAGMKPHRAIGGGEYAFPLAPSLDHLGFMTRTTHDLGVLFDVMLKCLDPWEKIKDEGRTLTALQKSEGPPRLARLRGFFDRRADSVARDAFDDGIAALVESGMEVIDLDDPVDFEQILAWHRIVLASEAAWIHDDDLNAFPDDYPDRIRDLVLEGRRANAVSYLKAHAEIRRIWFPLEVALMSGNLDAFITPATVTTAPDMSSTGDPAFNSPWSFTGLPTVSVPSGLAADGLPVAMQLIDRRGWEYLLLRTAEWCENAIRTSRQ